MKRLVIVGAGYGGINVALKLDSLSKGKSTWDVTLVDQHDYHLLQVRVHEVAANSIPAERTKIPFTELLGGKNLHFVHATVQKIDPVNKKVITSEGELSYDRLVISLGSVTDYKNIPGMREHTYPMKHLEDAVIYRRAVLKAFKEAAESAEKEPLVKSDPRLTFVVIGAGLTGTELAAEMVDFCSDICDRYPAMRPYYRVVLIHNSGYLLPQLGKINGEYVKQELKSKNVAVLTNSPVTKIEPGRAYLANGRYVRARLICWAGGIAGSPVIRQSNITTTEDGRIPVDPYLRSKQYPDIYALGDNAYVIDPKINKAVPQLGQFAWKQGEYLGQCFYNDLFGISNEPYEPFSMGISISLGRREALTLSGPLRLTGITGRIAKDVSYSNYEFAIRPKSQLLGLR